MAKYGKGGRWLPIIAGLCAGLMFVSGLSYFAIKAIFPKASAAANYKEQVQSSAMELLEKQKKEDSDLLSTYQTPGVIKLPTQRSLQLEIANNDIDIGETPSEEQVKSSIDAALSFAKVKGFSSIVFNVQYGTQTYFNSKLIPNGTALTHLKQQNPEFDILSYMTSAAKVLGIDVYASIEPLFAKTENEKILFGELHIAKLHPEWCIRNENGAIYLNPGYKEVREYVSDMVAELASNYEIKGVILKNPGYSKNEYLDEDIKNLYFEQLSIEEYRIWCINALIADCSKKLKDINPLMLFGVRVEPIWADKAREETGIDVPNGTYTLKFDGFMDAKEWAKKKWVDILMPTIFTTLTDEAMPFERIAKWWADNLADTQVSFMPIQAGHLVKADIPAWKDVYQLANQIKVLKGFTNYCGSVFTGYKELKSRPAAVDVISKSFSGSLVFKQDFTDLQISSPSKTSITTDQPVFAIRGGCDVNFPLIMNGKDIKVESNGLFAVDVQLKPGKNVYTFTHRETQKTITINYNVVVIKDLEPKNDLTLSSNSELAVVVLARKGSSVSGTLAGQKINFTTLNMTSDEAAQNSEDDTYSLFGGVFKISSVDKETAIGNVSVTASWGGFTKSLIGGMITVLPPPPVPKFGLVAEVTAIRAETFEADAKGYFYNMPSCIFIPQGTRDYVVNEVTNRDGTFLNLASGLRIYKSAAKTYDATEPLPSNTIKSISSEVTTKNTDLIFEITEKVPISVNFNTTFRDFDKSKIDYDFNTNYVADKFDFIIHNTKEAPELEEIKSPLFSSVIITKLNENTYKLTFTLTKISKFYGVSTFYDSNGKLVLRLKNPIVIDATAEKPYDGIRVILDLGHGGNDIGAPAPINGAANEKDLNLAIGLELRDKLTALGATVIMTRDSDITLTRAQRVDKIVQSDSDILFAIHCNANNSSAPNGTETLYYYPFNQKFANVVNAEVAGALGTVNRNEHYQSVFSIRESNMMVALIECGFMSNINEYNLLCSNINLIATKISDGMIKYFSA